MYLDRVDDALAESSKKISKAIDLGDDEKLRKELDDADKRVSDAVGPTVSGASRRPARLRRGTRGDRGARHREPALDEGLRGEDTEDLAMEARTAMYRSILWWPAPTAALTVITCSTLAEADRGEKQRAGHPAGHRSGARRRRPRVRRRSPRR